MNLTKFNQFILEIPQSPYPPYHEGMYLERYFIDFYIKNRQQFDETEFFFLPVCWTDIYLHRNDLIPTLQQILNELDPKLKYFTVSQHDDAPFQTLPPLTINFSAGGNQPGTIPIPLICGPIKYQSSEIKDIFCSFVGSVTQPLPGWGKISHDLRFKLLEVLKNNSKYTLKPKHWSPEIKQDEQETFLQITGRSKFTLCPRGYGATSFRLYEAMQLGSIPVYIYYKQPFLPFSDKLDWNKIAILVEQDNIENIDHILTNINNTQYNIMRNYINKIYPDYFTLEGMCQNILNTLINKKNHES
jgi:hypothetical protein